MIEENIVLEKVENILKPVAIGELLRHSDDKPLYNFYIPSYQRGYRWDTDEVNDLLEDLFEFIYQNAQEKYCLQPIVVKEMSDGKFEVLDGQQRLTTIFIILKSLKKYLPKLKSFTLSYQTRPNSETFLENLKDEEDEEDIEFDNPDYYFIDKAYKIINKWIDIKSETYLDISSVLYTALVQKIEFIWYQIIENTDAIEVFTRINIGKIPLTNAELVKALFLSKNNLLVGSKDPNINYLSLKQNKIAFEWDDLQNKLQNDNFWGFIYNGTKEYETRIDYILELISTSTSNNKYASFREFYKKIKANKSNEQYISLLSVKNTSIIENEWDNIRFIVQILEEWFENHYYFHHIGFLITQKKSIKNLITEYLKLDRDKFSDYLETEISEVFENCDLVNLRYSSKDNGTIQNILLLYNVLSTLKINDKNTKFPFHLYSNNKWSLEHIYAQNSNDLKADDYELWLRENLETLKNDSNASELTMKMKNLINNVATLKIDSTLFIDIFNEVSSYYIKNIEEIDSSLDEVDVDDTKEEDLRAILDGHSIVNLALLDSKSNSALNNSLFDVKRGKIINRDKQGYFVPLETKRVFFKYHTKFPKHISYWTKEDKIAYLKNIRQVLQKYIK